MIRRGHRGRVDTNHGEIVDALRKAGAFVQSLASVGHGCPDLLVIHRSRCYLFEAKATKKSRLTEDEALWHLMAGDVVHTVTTPEEALKFIGAL